MIQFEFFWLGEDEAILKFTEQNIKCLVFCHPCKKDIEKLDTSDLYFYALGSENIMMSNEDLQIFSTLDTFQCFIVGKIVSIDPDIVQVAKNIKIELDNCFPRDIKVGNRIQFKCARLDIF